MEGDSLAVVAVGLGPQWHVESMSQERRRYFHDICRLTESLQQFKLFYILNIIGLKYRDRTQGERSYMRNDVRQGSDYHLYYFTCLLKKQ